MLEFVTMFDDVCRKIYDVYERKTWFARLTMIEDDL